jgi:hypothetical protein
MFHPQLESLSNFVWRVAVPRPWPAQRVLPEPSDSAADRARIARNNARANLLLAAQAVVATPFMCVYVSAATHMGRQPGIFPFLGNLRAFRAIIEAEGALGLFKGATPLIWAHVLLGFVRTLRVRGLNPRTRKWEPYPKLTRLARWGCSLCIHALESAAYCMMIESTPEFANPLSAMRQLWVERSWMRGWMLSCIVHLSRGNALVRLPCNAIRLRLMTDPESRLWNAWNTFGWTTPLAGVRAYLWATLPLFLSQLVVMVATRLVVVSAMSHPPLPAPGSMPGVAQHGVRVLRCALIMDAGRCVQDRVLGTWELLEEPGEGDRDRQRPSPP